MFYLGCGLDGDDCMRLFNEIDALRARVDELTRERDVAVMVQKHGTPDDPSGVRNALTIQGLTSRLAASEARVAALEAALDAISSAHTIVVMNGGAGWSRHVEPAIYDAEKIRRAALSGAAPSGEVTK